MTMDHGFLQVRIHTRIYINYNNFYKKTSKNVFISHKSVHINIAITAIPNTSLYGIIAGLFVCVCIAGCVLAFFKGRLAGKEVQLKNSSTLSKSDQIQTQIIAQTNQLMKVASMSANTIQNGTDHQLDSLESLPKSDMNVGNNDATANIELTNLSNHKKGKLEISEGDYAITKGYGEESSGDNSNSDNSDSDIYKVGSKPTERDGM